jgi:RNA polymerase sigma-70 factor (ECF subfamily)
VRYSKTSLTRELPASNTDHLLVAQLIAKDRDAYNLLYNNYAQAMYSIIYRIVPNEADASDLLQDVFVKVWRKIELYDASKGSLFTWLLNICRNTAIDWRRSKGCKNDMKNDHLDNVKNFANSSLQVHYNTDHIGLKALSEKLGAEYSILIDAVYFQGYTHQEISDEFNIPLGTVKTRIRTALIRLRRLV